MRDMIADGKLLKVLIYGNEEKTTVCHRIPDLRRGGEEFGDAAEPDGLLPV